MKKYKVLQTAYGDMAKTLNMSAQQGYELKTVVVYGNLILLVMETEEETEATGPTNQVVGAGFVEPTTRVG